MTFELTTDKKTGRIRIRYEGHRHHVPGLGMCTGGGVLGYVETLPGGVLVCNMFEKPVKIFPFEQLQEAVEWAKNNMGPAE